MTAEPDTGKPGLWRRLTRGLPTWMERHPLTKDVYTRTVATVLSAAIVAGVAAVAGLIHLSAAGWGLVGLVAALVAAWPVVSVLTVWVKDEELRAALRFSIYSGVALTLVIIWYVAFRTNFGYVPNPRDCLNLRGQCPD